MVALNPAAAIPLLPLETATSLEPISVVSGLSKIALTWPDVRKLLPLDATDDPLLSKFEAAST